MKKIKLPLLFQDDPFFGLSKFEKEQLLRETEEKFNKMTKRIYSGVYTKRKYPE